MISDYTSFSRSLNHLFIITIGGNAECVDTDAWSLVGGCIWELTSDDFSEWSRKQVQVRTIMEVGGINVWEERRKGVCNCHLNEERELTWECGKISPQNWGSHGGP
jgi:hypothetical protein